VPTVISYLILTGPINMAKIFMTAYNKGLKPYGH